jgi:hypothetical protein
MKSDWHKRQTKQSLEFARRLDVIIGRLEALWRFDEINLLDLRKLDEIKSQITAIREKYQKD